MTDPFQRSHVVIQTPEGITFRLPLAAPSARFFALLIDFATISVIVSILTAILGLFQIFEVADLVSSKFREALVIFAGFATYLCYWPVFEHFWNGQTPGKRVMQIRVTDLHGMRLSFAQVVVRNLIRPVDMLPLFYLVGALSTLISPRMQRLGDIAANTIVISSRRPRQPALDRLAPLPHNSMRAYPWIEARLRRQTTAEEASLLVQALLRRENLDPVARISVFRELVSAFRAKTAIPDEATAGLTDEQLARSLVESLYRDGHT